MGEHFHGLGEQLQRFANVPAMLEGQVLQDLVQQNHNILEQLALMNGRLDGLNGRLDGLDDRLNRLEGKFDDLNGKFDRLENRVSAEYVGTPSNKELANTMDQASQLPLTYCQQHIASAGAARRAAQPENKRANPQPAQHGTGYPESE